MDEHERLHAAIKAYLLRHNQRAVRKTTEPPVPLAAARCRSCGRPIIDPDVIRAEALGPLLAARLCVGCYVRDAADCSRDGAGGKSRGVS